MISCMTKRYIDKRAKEKDKKVPDNYLETLRNIEKIEIADGKYFRFSWCFNHEKCIIANSFHGKFILLNPEWAFYLIFYVDDELKNALNITIGHELTHREKELLPLGLSKRKRKFIRWVNEVRADFVGAYKRVNGDRQKLLESIKYKKARHPIGDTYAHPLWETREEYAKNYDFGPKLIDRIAIDVGYHNEKFINKVKNCKYYKDIKLNNPKLSDDQ